MAEGKELEANLLHEKVRTSGKPSEEPTDQMY